jgi:hypothetical protein
MGVLHHTTQIVMENNIYIYIKFLFYPENGETKLLRNVCTNLPNYIALGDHDVHFNDIPIRIIGLNTFAMIGFLIL